MWTYSAISLAVMLAVLLAGLLGFAAGWMTRRAVVEERKQSAEAHDELGRSDPRAAPPSR